MLTTQLPLFCFVLSSTDKNEIDRIKPKIAARAPPTSVEPLRHPTYKTPRVVPIPPSVFAHPIEGIPRRSGGGLCPNTGVTWPDIELFPKPTLDLPRPLPPMFLVKFRFAMPSSYLVVRRLGRVSSITTGVFSWGALLHHREKTDTRHHNEHRESESTRELPNERNAESAEEHRKHRYAELEMRCSWREDVIVRLMSAITVCASASCQNERTVGH